MDRTEEAPQLASHPGALESSVGVRKIARPREQGAGNLVLCHECHFGARTGEPLGDTDPNRSAHRVVHEHRPLRQYAGAGLEQGGRVEHQARFVHLEPAGAGREPVASTTEVARAAPRHRDRELSPPRRTRSSPRAVRTRRAATRRVRRSVRVREVGQRSPTCLPSGRSARPPGPGGRHRRAPGRTRARRPRPRPPGRPPMRPVAVSTSGSVGLVTASRLPDTGHDRVADVADLAGLVAEDAGPDPVRSVTDQ